jgi:hypothetical protein
MKKTLLLLVFSLVMSQFGFSQTEKAWSNFTGQDVKVALSAQRESFPQDFQLLNVDLAILKQSLLTATDRFAANSTNVIITLPNAAGKLERFRVYEASNFAPELQAQFPDIRSYVGHGLDDKTAIVRLSLDPRGIQTMVFRANTGAEFMEPYSDNGLVYAVYKSSRKKGKLPFTCSTPEEVLVHNLATDQITSRSNSGSLLTFRLALSCNGEYANYFGATSAAQSALVLAQFNATMTRVNGVFEKDFAIHMNIVPQTTNVIYYDPTSDPYTTLSNWNTQLQQALNTTLTGVGSSISVNNAAYDIGHMFGSTGGGGNAGCIGCVCVDGSISGAGSTKGRGITSPSDGVPMGDTFDIDYVVHEMGHQFGANHTFSHNSEGAGVNVEVGGGVTIMGYAGITNYNTHMNSIDIFHAVSIAQVQANMVGKTCPTVTAITHSAPVVSAGADYTVPLSTPFVLTGSATDAGGTSLMTYTWEQNDDAGASTGASSPASETKTEGPNFACYTDASIPVRYFPVFSSILNGSTTTAGASVTAEALSSVARALNFRLTARDNVNGQGQTGFDDMVVTVANKTALAITMATSTTYPTGSSQTVVWTGATGANGHQTIAGGANVDISFSADNGVTWTTLVTNTPNDGSQAVTLPAGVSAPYCRFMVKANANIFFNVSRAFAVGDYTYQSQNVCTDYPFTLNSVITESSDNSYPGVTLSIADSFTITDANFYANVTHPNIGQVNVLIKAPWQTALNTAIWYNNATCTGANLNKWFDTSGSAVNCATTNGTPSFLPFSVTNINGYNGNNSAGAWLIYFKDVVVDTNVSAALFNSFTIQLCRSALVPVLATENYEMNDLAIYPNPNKGNFNIQFTSSTGNEIKVGVHDMRGREIFNKTYSNSVLFNENLQLNNVQTGIYFVTIQDGSSKVTKKIVVE